MVGLSRPAEGEVSGGTLITKEARETTDERGGLGRVRGEGGKVPFVAEFAQAAGGTIMGSTSLTSVPRETTDERTT